MKSCTASWKFVADSACIPDAAANAVKPQDGLCGGPPDGSVGDQIGYDGGLGNGGKPATGGACVV